MDTRLASAVQRSIPNRISAVIDTQSEKVRYTYESWESTVLKASDDKHAIDVVLKLRHFLSLGVGVAELRNQDVQKDDDHHRHVAQNKYHRQPSENNIRVYVNTPNFKIFDEFKKVKS